MMLFVVDCVERCGSTAPNAPRARQQLPQSATMSSGSRIGAARGLFALRSPRRAGQRCTEGGRYSGGWGALLAPIRGGVRHARRGPAERARCCSAGSAAASSERSSGRAVARRCSGAGGAGGRTAASRGGRRSRASPPPSARPTAAGQRGLRPRRRGLASGCCRARRSAPCWRAAAAVGFARCGCSRALCWLADARFPPAAERSCPSASASA